MLYTVDIYTMLHSGITDTNVDSLHSEIVFPLTKDSDEFVVGTLRL